MLNNVEHFDKERKPFCRHKRRDSLAPPFYNSAMGLRIRELREGRGWTQQHLAELAGISRSQLSEVENEAKTVNIRRLDAIAKALGVDLPSLFSQSGRDPYESAILNLLPSMSESDRAAVVRHAEALAARKSGR